MTSRLLRHIECPKCHIKGRKKTCGVFDDGHEYCFYPCGYYKPSSLKARMERKKMTTPENKGVQALPADTRDDYFSDVCLHWLGKYGITTKEMIAYDIRWSSSKQWLIFPFRGGTTSIIAWQARCFAPDAKTKWFSQGKLDDLVHIVNASGYKNENGVCVVEDIVSAIKVGRSYPCMCNFGSHVSDVKLVRLYNNVTSGVKIWLDKDKTKEAMKFCKHAGSIGLQPEVVMSELDPKQYSDDEIKQFLGLL